MKTAKCLLAMFAMAMIVGVAQADLAFYYPMNGENPGIDASGNGFDLVDNGTSPFVSPGFSGDSSDGFAELNQTTDILKKTGLTSTEIDLINTETFTFEVWIRNPGWQSGQEQLGLMQYRNGNGRVGFRMPSSDGGASYKLGLSIDTSDPWALIESSSTVTFEDDKWYHIAIVYDNNGDAAANDSTVSFYCTQLGETSPTLLGSVLTGQKDLNPLSAGGTLIIGGNDSWFPSTRMFLGDLDEVRYTNAALTSVELNFPAVPEPSTVVLLFGAVVGLLIARRRKP